MSACYFQVTIIFIHLKTVQKRYETASYLYSHTGIYTSSLFLRVLGTEN